MNVLISGNLSCLTTTLVKSFLKEQFRVVLVGSDAQERKSELPDVSVHSVSPAADYFHEVVAAHKFDVIVYLSTREEQLLDDTHPNTGQGLDGLLNTLELCRKEGIRKIFYVSSSEVYGSQAFCSEETEPQPATPNGFTLRTGEQYCQYYSQQYGLTPTIIRLPFVYGPGERSSFLFDIIKKCKERKPVALPGHPDMPCSFLHAADVADFILRSLDETGSGCQIVNLSSADPLTLAELAKMLQVHFPEGKFEFDSSQRIYTQPLEAVNARRKYDWIAEHKLHHSFAEIIQDVGRQPSPKKYLIEKITSRFPRFPVLLKWTEVFLGAALMHGLSGLSGSVVEFRYVDFRLAYVVLLGSVHGTRIGLVASALAALSVLINWSTLGLDWIELIYNVSNWLPFALYLTAGAITGYFHDKKENQLRNQEDQIRLIKEKYKFLYDLYQEVSQLKNQFHRQLVGSRDSFGRIFKIAQELDSLEEEEIIFKALKILEDVMDNRSIAIYAINPANCYARLEIYSNGLNGQIKKSWDLREYPELLQSINTGDIYQNRDLKPNYPAYFVPICNDSTTVAAVVLWNANFEQHSLYYYNLLKVICGLVQSSIKRVALFMDANIDKFYVPNTRILQPEAFKKVLKVKNTMKKHKLGDYFLVMVFTDSYRNDSQCWKIVYEQIAGETRAEDYIGLLDDGNCYILFSQADTTNASSILQRLARRNILCEPVPDPFALTAEGAVPQPVYSGLQPVPALPSE